MNWRHNYWTQKQSCWQNYIRENRCDHWSNREKFGLTETKLWWTISKFVDRKKCLSYNYFCLPDKDGSLYDSLVCLSYKFFFRSDNYFSLSDNYFHLSDNYFRLSDNYISLYARNFHLSDNNFCLSDNYFCLYDIDSWLYDQPSPSRDGLYTVRTKWQVERRKYLM